VKLLTRYGALEQKLNLTLVDKQKHYQGARRGEVLAVGENIPEVKAGDVVWFHGAQGKSFDENSAGFNDGTGMRALKWKDLLAAEESCATPA
jgi:co-chaperonin GroES (HSP10)